MKHFNAAFIIFAGFSFFLQAQTLTQQEFLDQLIQAHPIFEKEKLAPKIESQAQQALAGNEDWNVFASSSLSYEEPIFSIVGPERTSAFHVNAGVERLYWKSGGRLSASFSMGYANIKLDPIFNFPNDFFQNQLAVSYSHPFMKNRKGFLDQLAFSLKQFDIDFSEVEAMENLENFVAESLQKFLDWVFLTEQAKIINERIKLNEDELERIKRKRDAYLVENIDVIRAKDAVRFWKQNLALVESQWKSLQGELAVLTKNDKLYDLNPEHNLYETIALAPLDETTIRLKQNSRLLNILDIRLDQLHHLRRGFEETAKPDLSLITQVGFKNYDPNFPQSLVLNKPDAAVVLDFRFPLENRTAKANMNRTDLQITQLEKEKEDILVTLTSALTHISIQINEAEDVLQLNKEQIQSAQEKTVEELNRYNQGRGDLAFVLLSRDDVENAKLTYAQNALAYQKLIITYQEVMDELY